MAIDLTCPVAPAAVNPTAGVGYLAKVAGRARQAAARVQLAFTGRGSAGTFHGAPLPTASPKSALDWRIERLVFRDDSKAIVLSRGDFAVAIVGEQLEEHARRFMREHAQRTVGA